MKKLLTTNYSLLTTYRKLQNWSLRTVTLQLCLLLTSPPFVKGVRGILIAYCLLFTAHSFATVKNTTSGTVYTALSNAVFAAGIGDTLLVSTGTYYETIDVYDKDLTIEGEYKMDFTGKVSGGKSIIYAPGSSFFYSGSVFDVTNSTLMLIGLEITDGGFSFSVNGSGGGMNIRYDSDVTLFSCSIHNNFAKGNGGGIYLYHSSLYATNTFIYGNKAYLASIGFGDNGCGGGIYASGSSIELYNFCNISTNLAVSKGGGIRLNNSDVNFNRGKLHDNYADEGGGVAAEHSSYNQLSFVYLYNNMANTKGGGILLENNSTATNSNSGCYVGFKDPWGANSVTNGSGGGFYIADSTLVLKERAAVAHNNATKNGGGIFCTNGTIFVDGGYVGVDNNNYTNSAYSGGDIYAISSILQITNSAIICGIAVNGGGIFLNNCSTEIKDSEFIKNLANGGYGGGILLYSSNIFHAVNSSFNNNYASFGGGICLYSENGDVNFESCNICSNQSFSGGGMFSGFNSRGSIMISGSSIIQKNEAQDFGGGLLLFLNSNLSLSNSALSPLVINSNFATKNGGGFYMETYNSLDIKGNVMFNDNVALEDGGGICAVNQCLIQMSNIGYLSPKIFGNTAWKSGGGMFIEGSNSIANLNDVVFGDEGLGNICKARTGNTGGGAIFITESAEVNALNCAFEENYSSNNGGAIYLGTNAILNMSSDSQSESYLYNNTTRSAGGGIYSMLADELIIENVFVASNKTQSGGAGGLYIGKTDSKLVNLIVAQNDCAYSSGADGIFFYDCVKSEVLECTIVDNDKIGVLNNLAGTVYMTNCIVYGHSVNQLRANSPIEAVYSDIENGYPGAGNINTDPLFHNPALFNYILDWNSPCINAGTDLPAVTNDFIGVVRPQGGAWDIGAFENYAKIMVSKSVLDFDELVIGESSNLVLNVRNIGTAWFEGSVSNVLNPPFSDNSFGTYSLYPSDSTNITFTFAPVVEGAFTNIITCTGGGNIDVELRGTAVPEPCYLLFILFNLLFIGRKFIPISLSSSE